MKQFFTILLLLCSFNIAFAESKEVAIETIRSSGASTRSLVQKPSVQIDTDAFQLSIKFAVLTESYTLYVYDDNGFVVYQSAIMTDGSQHAYTLVQLDEGSYTIVIESNNKYFGGEFLI